MLPTRKGGNKKHGKMKKQTLDTVFDSYPILKNFIYTHNDAEALYKKTILS